MSIFLSTLNQMGFLCVLIVIGYILRKLKAVPDNTASALSKLENKVLVPALVLGTFMEGFTVSSFSTAWQYILGGAVVVGISIPVAIIVSRICSRDAYIRNLFTYGLSFSNFGFVGNAVVMALFPAVFTDYLIFVIPLWFMIYVWGVPILLIPKDEKKSGILGRLKAFVNPMFIAMLIGMIFGICGVTKYLPDFAVSSVKTLGDCMSPIAMLLTGMTVAEIDLKKALSNFSVYAVTAVRLLIIPLITIGALCLIDVPYPLAICIICSVSMPLGLNTIVIPKAYDLDSTVASGMALISHLLSIGTIPLVFMIFELLVK